MQQNSAIKLKPDWESLITERENSGLSQKKFCEQQGLVLSQFVYHRCLFKSMEKKIQPANAVLKPVKLIGNDMTGDIRLSLPNGFQCSFPCSLDINQIKNWLRHCCHVNS